MDVKDILFGAVSVGAIMLAFKLYANASPTISTEKTFIPPVSIQAQSQKEKKLREAVTKKGLRETVTKITKEMPQEAPITRPLLTVRNKPRRVTSSDISWEKRLRKIPGVYPTKYGFGTIQTSKGGFSTAFPERYAEKPIWTGV